ncbi:MAG: hypothetical protein BRD38_02010 [Bacteroidetes bacterium QH_9_67_14]|nr:MAG: hypothetical protein BRD38_02010 [Bacteroidetes bacterium QH_9_67_14]
MFLNYLLLALISAGTLIWAYRHAPGRDDPPHGGGNGGLPVGGDSYPSSEPPSVVVDTDDRTREDDPSPGMAA